MTLKRIDAVAAILRDYFPLLRARDGLFFGDEERNQQQLLRINAEHRQLAQRYQLGSPGPVSHCCTKALLPML